MYGDDHLKQTVLIITIRNHNFFPEEMCENSSVYLHNTKLEKKAQKQDTTKKRFSQKSVENAESAGFRSTNRNFVKAVDTFSNLCSSTVTLWQLIL